MKTIMKKYLARWCCGWVSILEGVIEVLTLGMWLTHIRLHSAKYFAKKQWF